MKQKPYERLTTKGHWYEVTVISGDDFTEGYREETFKGEFCDWNYEERTGVLYAVIWEDEDNRAYEYYVGDIVDVKPIEKPLARHGRFFTPYKDREVILGEQVEVYRNLHTENGYSIRCAKTKLVLSHCSTVSLENAKFIVNEAGRQKTVSEKRKRVHAFIRGELTGINDNFPVGFTKILYNPYYHEKFTHEVTQKPVFEAGRVYCSGKYAYAADIQPVFSDKEVQDELIDMGYNLNDENGRISDSIFIECAINEGFEWDEKKGLWSK